MTTTSPIWPATARSLSKYANNPALLEHKIELALVEAYKRGWTEGREEMIQAATTIQNIVLKP